MGCCLCIRRATAVPNNDTSEGAGAVAIGRNQPLKPEKPRWASDHAMTEEQLRSQRDQFWDTAPAFEGHKEIWDALKAAAYALESGDHLLAQAIVDGANIMLPTGSLEDCYDELGSRYQLPVYVLSAPTNLQLDSSDVDELPEKLSPSSKKQKRGSEVPIRLQLSTGSVMRLTVRTNDSVLLVKQHVAATAGVNVKRVRLFFAGKQLTDSARLKEVGLRKNYTLQAVISDARFSKSSLQVDTADIDVVESPSSTEEPSSEVKSTLPVLTGTLAVSSEQLGSSSAAVPTTGSEESPGQMETSMALVPVTESEVNTEQIGTPFAHLPGTESEAPAAGDSPTVSVLPKDVKTSSGGLDTPF